MICLIALVVFGILGIFSASNRKVAAEAFDCVFRKMTLRKCHTGLDKRLKSQIISRILQRSPKLGKFVYKNFEMISWFFTLLMIVSMILSVRGLYLFAVYGNCNGPQSDAFCVFDPQGFNKQSYLNFTLPDVKIMPDADDDPFLGSPDARVTIIEFGCYKCPYTAKAESAVDEILSYYGDDVKFVFRDFPVSNPHLGADINAEAANCAIEQGRFWEYHDKLFQSIQEGCQVPLNDTNIEPHIINLLQYATELGMDETRFRECLTSRRYKEEVSDDFADGINAGVRGTPTFFIGDQVIVGPKPFSTFRKIIDRGLKS